MSRDREGRQTNAYLGCRATRPKGDEFDNSLDLWPIRLDTRPSPKVKSLTAYQTCVQLGLAHNQAQERCVTARQTYTYLDSTYSHT
jgi:hypothetical protein